MSEDHVRVRVPRIRSSGPWSCPLCGLAPRGGRTDEHVLPKWMHALFGSGNYLWVEGVAQERPYVVVSICRACNAWLNVSLEQPAQPNSGADAHETSRLRGGPSDIQFPVEALASPDRARASPGRSDWLRVLLTVEALQSFPLPEMNSRTDFENWVVRTGMFKS